MSMLVRNTSHTFNFHSLTIRWHLLRSPTLAKKRSSVIARLFAACISTKMVKRRVRNIEQQAMHHHTM